MIPNLKVCEMENEMGEGKRKRTESPNLVKSHEIRERFSRVTNAENSCGTPGNRDTSAISEALVSRLQHLTHGLRTSELMTQISVKYMSEGFP